MTLTRRSLCLLIIVLIPICSAFSQPGKSEWAGQWSGIIETPAGGLSMELDLRKNAHWKGTLDIPSLEAEDAVIDSITIENDSIFIPLDEKITLSGQQIFFKGMLNRSAGQITGELIRKETYFYRETITHRVRLATTKSQATPGLRDFILSRMKNASRYAKKIRFRKKILRLHP